MGKLITWVSRKADSFSFVALTSTSGHATRFDKAASKQLSCVSGRFRRVRWTGGRPPACPTRCRAVSSNRGFQGVCGNSSPRAEAAASGVRWGCLRKLCDKVELPRKGGSKRYDRSVTLLSRPGIRLKLVLINRARYPWMTSRKVDSRIILSCETLKKEA